MVAAMREAIAPLQTGNQQIVQAHRQMAGAVNAQASAMGSRMDTHLAHSTQLMHGLGGQIAQNATDSGSLVLAIARQHVLHISVVANFLYSLL